MSLNTFTDVTNVAQVKRRGSFQGRIQKPKEEPVMTVAMFEELSGKIDCFSQKLDAIYDVLLALLPQQPQMPQSLPHTECMEASRSGSHVEEQNIVTLFNNALQQHQPHGSQSDTSVCAEPSEPMVESGTKTTSVREEEPRGCDSTRFSSFKSAGKGKIRGTDELHTWSKRDCCIVLVEFKCQRVRWCESTIFIVPGLYAIVQGDRGYDCGVVNQCSEWSAEKGCFTREESLDGAVVSVARLKSDMGRVLRVATEEEVERLFGEIARNENLALKTCREIVTRMGLDMEVVDCEYQFDQQKISFYYEASRSIDFRQLNSELYRIFGVRIWLQNLNSAVKNVVPTGAMSKDDKAQYQRSGLRPLSFK